MPPKKRASTAAKPAADAAATPSARAPRVNKKGTPVDARYLFRQWFGTVLAVVAFAMVAFAGYAPEQNMGTVNQWLYGGIVVAFVGLLFHECRPYKSDARFTFDPEAVAFKKREIAEMEAKAAAKKGK
jgi:hypothetical protein